MRYIFMEIPPATPIKNLEHFWSEMKEVTEELVEKTNAAIVLVGSKEQITCSKELISTPSTRGSIKDCIALLDHSSNVTEVIKYINENSYSIDHFVILSSEHYGELEGFVVPLDLQKPYFDEAKKKKCISFLSLIKESSI